MGFARARQASNNPPTDVPSPPPVDNPRGGTNFPLALYEALRLTAKSKAHKKLVIMLTDGDINGRICLDDLLRFARQSKIEVITIGVQGSDRNSLRQSLGKDQVLYVEDIHELPEEMRRLAIRKA